MTKCVTSQTQCVLRQQIIINHNFTLSLLKISRDIQYLRQPFTIGRPIRYKAKFAFNVNLDKHHNYIHKISVLQFYFIIFLKHLF